MPVSNNPHKKALIELAHEIRRKAEPDDADQLSVAIMKYEEMDDSLAKVTTDLILGVISKIEFKRCVNITLEAIKNAD